MRVHSIHHVAFEGLGSIEPWVRQYGHSLTSTHLYLRQPFPSNEEIDLLIVMGGPMNIYEEDTYPWLAEEKRFIGRTIDQGGRVLGICLGAQLLADVLGARVYKGKHKEIGWFPVETTDAAEASTVFRGFPKSTMAFHWHGDTFDIPRGATHIARSAACENQAFIYEERIIGLQFHLETTLESGEQLIVNCGDELVSGPYIQDAVTMLAEQERFQAINKLMQGLLLRLTSAPAERTI